MAYARIFTNGKFQGIDNDGNVVANGKLYITDTSGNPVNTYQDSSMTILNSYPIVLDISGKADVYLDAGTYNIRLTDSNDVEIWSINEYYQPTANFLEQLEDDTSPTLGGNLDTNGYKIGKIEQDYSTQNESKFMENEDFTSNGVRYGLNLTYSSSSLNITIGTGKAYVEHKRVYIDSSYSISLMASADNYIDLDTEGNFHITSVSVGSTEPSVYSNSIRLYKATTDTGGVISYEDRRENIHIYVPRFGSITGHQLYDDGSNFTILRFFNPLVIKDYINTDLQISNNNQITLPNQSFVYAYFNGSQTISSSTYTKVAVNTILVDRKGEFDTTNHRFTALESGLYYVQFNLMFYSSSYWDQHEAITTIYKNGSFYVVMARRNGSGSDYMFLNGSKIIELDAGDYIEEWVYQNTGYNFSLYPGLLYQAFIVYKIA